MTNNKEQVMNKPSGILKRIGYTFGASIAASLIVLLIGMFVFGFQIAEWPEWQGRIVGVVVTIAGVVAAVVGLQIALRGEATHPL
jgi:hypothetical protein